MFGLVSRGLAYSSFMVVGGVLIADPVPSLTVLLVAAGVPITSLLFGAIILWGVIFLIASLTCLLGVITRTWIGEYIGLIPLVVCILTFGIAQFTATLHVGGVLMLGLSAILLYRLYLVLVERSATIAKHQSEVSRRRPPLSPDI